MIFPWGLQLRIVLCDLAKNRWFNLAAKGALSTLTLYLAVRHMGVQPIFERLRVLDAWGLVAALAICVAQTALVSVRWHWLIRYLGGRLALWRTFCLVEICSFFSQALPATVGVDAVRVMQAWQNGVPMSSSVSSVLFDRAFGVAGIVAAGLIGLPFASRRLGYFESEMLVAGAVAIVVGLLILRSRRRWLAWLPPKLGNPMGALLEDGVRLLVLPAAWIWALGPAIAVQFLSTLLIYVALRQFGTPVGFVECVLSVTLALLIAALPISIAGWGVREGALVFALGALGVPPAEAVASSLLAGIAQFVAALPGGLLLLVYTPPAAPHEGKA